MPGRRGVSVCMATYNGARFVTEQVRSILDQLEPDDELVVVDDASTDDTVQVLRSIDDARVDVHVLPANLGHVGAFEVALSRSHRPLVFLADQDDTWPPGRLDTMVRALDDTLLVVGNVTVPDGSVFRPEGAGRGFALTDVRRPARWPTIGRLALSQLPYHGCAMGVRRELLDAALPFPPAVRELHDGWLGLVGLVSGSVSHLADPVVVRRVHEANVSGRVRGPVAVVRGRACFVAMLVAAWRRRGQLSAW